MQDAPRLEGDSMDGSWEKELAGLLSDLLAVQEELLALLARKRELLAAADVEGLTALGPDVERLTRALQECVDRRQKLLDRARAEGKPSSSLRALMKAAPRSQRAGLDESFSLAASRARLLRHHCITNWVVIQRTLLHLARLLEIIATGGKLQPTYGKEAVQASGVLVDRAA